MDRLLFSDEGNTTTGASTGWRRLKWISTSYRWPAQNECGAPRNSSDQYTNALNADGAALGETRCWMFIGANSSGWACTVAQSLATNALRSSAMELLVGRCTVRSTSAFVPAPISRSTAPA